MTHGPSYVLCPSVDVERRRKFEQMAGQPLHMYSGSSKGRCTRCEAEVWIGPRSTEVVRTGAALPICEAELAPAMLVGWRPKVVINLENPEGSRVS